MLFVVFHFFYQLLDPSHKDQVHGPVSQVRGSNFSRSEQMQVQVTMKTSLYTTNDHRVHIPCELQPNVPLEPLEPLNFAVLQNLQ